MPAEPLTAEELERERTIVAGLRPYAMTTTTFGYAQRFIATITARDAALRQAQEANRMSINIASGLKNELDKTLAALRQAEEEVGRLRDGHYQLRQVNADLDSRLTKSRRECDQLTDLHSQTLIELHAALKAAEEVIRKHFAWTEYQSALREGR